MKVLVLIRILVPLALLGWLYLRHGWRAGYNMRGSAELKIEHAGQMRSVREMRSRIGWPIWALIEVPATRHALFSVRPQPRLRLSAELEIGHPSFDDAFLLGTESVRFAQRLRTDASLRGHFDVLPIRLARLGSPLSRVVGDEGKLCLEVNVRWSIDRPRLYREALTWLVELDQLLSAESSALNAGRHLRQSTNG